MLVQLAESWVEIQDFLVAGGTVLLWIGAVLFLLWTLIIERFWYLRTLHPQAVQNAVKAWTSRPETRSWHAAQIRRRLIAEVSESLNRSLGTINTLVAVCPLLGLLGTVTGMIEVFDIMAVTGSSSARAMATGVTKATIPTMAGMVAALSALYPSVSLQQRARSETQRTADLLVQR